MIFTLLTLWGCDTPPTVALMTDGDGFYDRPWPDDRRTIDGRPDLEGFSPVGDNPLVNDFIAFAESLDGFGNNTPIYLRFDGPIDRDRLPSPEASLSPDADLFLINVDPKSPRRGELTPFEWDFQENSTNWQPDNLLAIQPVWGAPLEPATTYALVIKRGFANGPNDFIDVWQDEHDEHDYYEQIHQTLFQVRVSAEDIAYAFKFTTQDPIKEVSQIVDAIDSWVPRPPLTDATLSRLGNGAGYKHYRGRISVPMWQEGDKPYASEGGGFVFDDDGNPVLFGWDRTRFSLTVPYGPTPDDGWPLVIYSHGTGGNQNTFVGSPDSPASVLGRSGVAVFGISQPLHGDRSDVTNVELYSFNYLNPPAGRTMFRQGALDQVYLSRIFTERAITFTADDGETIPLNPDQVGYLGHSHGGQVGAIAAAFFGDRIGATVFNGTGGGLAITIIERKAEGLDIEAIIKGAVQLDDDEELDETHPVTALVQMNAEATDPLNYAPYWFQRRAPYWDNPPINIIQTEGLNDPYTPPRTTEAIAGAAGLPILTPVESPSLIHDLIDVGITKPPAAGNAVGWDGTPVTVGLAQYPDIGHFAIFDLYEAMTLYRDFLITGLMDESAEIPAR
ncbi:MAG: hypothetical protein AAFV53_10235 [Myxococcota bacterium]